MTNASEPIRSYACPFCQKELPPMAALGQTVLCPHCNSKVHMRRKGQLSLAGLGYLCVPLAFLLPLPGAIAGVACGAINLSRGETLHGVVQMVASVAAGLCGFLFGLSLMR